MSDEIRIEQMNVDEVSDLLEVSFEDAQAIREYVRSVGDLSTAIAALAAVTDRVERLSQSFPARKVAG